jgi:hypothetical protein
MRSRLRLPVVIAAALILAAGSTALPASADHAKRPNTKNIDARGHSVQEGTFAVPDGQRVISSDLAFQGVFAYQGNYDGFRVIDISDPDNPELVAHPKCNGDQGDVVVWDDILIRSWNSPRDEVRNCDGEPVLVGFEGVHIFDISDPSNPSVIDVDGPHLGLELPCGSHTATAAGVDDGDLIVYSNNSSSAGCEDGTRANDDPEGDFMDVIGVPLANPAAASLINRVELAGPELDIRTGCHDVGVHLPTDMAVGACNDTINVWDISDPREPVLLRTITEPGVGIGGRWHSGAFSDDGSVILAGWEPGGGAEAECQATDDDVKKSMFFYDTATGAKLGQWVLPRPQSGNQNCTIHNYNVVPGTERDIVVSGNYQAGTWVTDFTDPANPTTVAWSDPKTLGPGPFCSETNPPGCQLGGAWSSYWYNDVIYESDITRGLNLFTLNDATFDGSDTLARLNPQTQE